MIGYIIEKENKMIYFNCDYTEGAHPSILKSLTDTNFTQYLGYGDDDHTRNAQRLIKEAIDCPTADVHFLVGGTQVNLTFISSALRPHQGVMAATTGHISTHESGAIEATGHKVITLNSEANGKVSAELAEKCITEHLNDVNHEHSVYPKMVYISNSTENGCVYTKKEISELSEVCKKYSLYLYMDGARLGYALASPKSDLTLADIAKYCDAFYIGGTKVGAMFGEALVIVNDSLKDDFRYIIKQKGALMAKGWVLGTQFECLFTDNLYMQISKSAVDKAFTIAYELKAMGVEFLAEPESNQIFPIFTDEQVEKINEKYATALWEKLGDNRNATRICTSWATTDINVHNLVKDIKEILCK